MAKKNTENSTDTTRDQEIAGNTPSGRDQTTTDTSPANDNTAVNDSQNTDNASSTDNTRSDNVSPNTPVPAEGDNATPVTDKPGTDTTQTVQADPAANQEQLGVNHNERIGRWKEEAKQRAARARSELDSFINFLDELG